MKKLLLKTAMVVGAMLLGMTLQAQVFQPIQTESVYNPSGKVVPDMTTHHSNLLQDQDATKQMWKAPKAEGEMCTLRINLDYDREHFTAPFPPMVDVINDNGEGYRLWDFTMQGLFEQSVAAGTYHVFCQFNSTKGVPYFIIKEAVEITEDLTMTLSPEDATEHIVIKNYGPDGELLRHDMGYFDNETNQYVIDKGSIEETEAKYIIYLRGFGPIFMHYFDIISVTCEEDQYLADYYITDISDRFFLTQTRVCKDHTIIDKPIYYVNYFSTDNVKIGVLENSPASYVHQTETFKYSPYGLTQVGHGSGYSVWTNQDNICLSGFSANRFYNSPKNGDTYSIETWINLPETDPIDNSYSTLFLTTANDYGDTHSATGWIQGTPMALKDGNLMKDNFGHHGSYTSAVSQEYNYLYAVINDNNINSQLLPAPEAFCYPAERVLGLVGDNCPINALQITTYKANDQLHNSLMSYYVGRYGEVRWNNEGAYWAKRKFNGEEVDLETFATSGIGTRECTVINPNVEVDGLEGHNTTTVYYDQNQEDMTPPSIEMLHFKNADGGVTDRFATADEGTMEFYASDFHYQYYPDLWNGVFECQPVEVLVEYAPYGTENWNELTVEEIPELYQEPGWGYFYRGSLAEVTGQGLNGWFDLRFRLQDASGNWMDQVVSPAFRIDDLAYSSVATIGSGDAHEVARYSIDGKRVDASHQGVTIIRMSDGTARKVLVK